jgi:hypothetical protein
MIVAKKFILCRGDFELSSCWKRNKKIFRFFDFSLALVPFSV